LTKRTSATRIRRTAALAAICVAAALVLTIGTVFTVRKVRIKRALVYNEAGQIVGIRQLEDEPCNVYGFADSGKDILALQDRLQHYGYYAAEPTGFYGTDTVAAMQAFQLANALPVNGMADAQTQAVLQSDDAVSSAAYEITCSNAAVTLEDGTLLSTVLSSAPMIITAQVEVWDETSGEFVEMAEGQDYEQSTQDETQTADVDDDNLKLGDESPRVAEIQTRLQELGYYRGASQTNYYGTMMQQAVYNFQKANGMSMDGVCGESTQNAIFSDDAVSFDDYIASGGVEYSARDELVAELVQYAKRFIGCPYVWAGAGPSVFDCSGYTMYVYKHFGYNFGHGCSVQSNALGAKLSVSQLLPGDIVFFDTNGGHNSLEHVGIYIGNGDFVHASSGGGQVMISNLYSGYYNTNFMWGKRVIPL